MVSRQLPTSGGKHRRRRRRTGAVIAGAVVAVLTAGAMLAVGRDAGPPVNEPGTAEQAASARGASTPSVPADRTPTSSPSPTSTSPAVQVEAVLGMTTAAPMEAVSVSGRVSGVAAGTPVRVEMWHPDGRWIAFPLEPVVGGSGSFRTYVEVGRRGTHRLRVVESGSDVTSEVLSLRIS